MVRGPSLGRPWLGEKKDCHWAWRSVTSGVAFLLNVHQQVEWCMTPSQGRPWLGEEESVSPAVLILYVWWWKKKGKRVNGGSNYDSLNVVSGEWRVESGAEFF